MKEEETLAIQTGKVKAFYRGIHWQVSAQSATIKGHPGVVSTMLASILFLA
jgi:hypothetical protein